MGREVYLARAHEREIYSGEDRFTRFTDSGPRFWIDFRLFAGSQPGAVQQAEVAFAGESYILRRSGAGWVLQGNEAVALAAPRVEAWLRLLLETEGEGFAVQAPATVEGSVTLWFGDGTSRAVQVGPPVGENYRQAAVSGSPLVYVLSEWTVSRIFPEAAHFMQ